MDKLGQISPPQTPWRSEHEDVHLSDGLVVENTIECPKHSSIFNMENGEVETPPACENLHTYPTKVDADRVFVDI
ncbi:MAG: hypothetical protein EBT90_14105 [Rhodobacteraceae bacterium]|nr:hypothetical protein [Paracoccaceae bacterium]